jgi:hypothetical protein
MKTFLSTSFFLRCILLLTELKHLLAQPEEPDKPPLADVIVNMGDPCTIEAYEAAYIGESDPKDILKNLEDATWTSKDGTVHNVISNLDQICAPVKEEVIDHLQFRCGNIARHSETPDYKCICDSEKMSTVDFRAKQPISSRGGLREYNAIQGLDQKLTFDLKTMQCYSGENGHCTLDRFVDKREADGVGVMKCFFKLKCEEGNGSFKFGNEMYGVCRKEDSKHSKFDRSANKVDSVSSCQVKTLLTLGVIANLYF